MTFDNTTYKVMITWNKRPDLSNQVLLQQQTFTVTSIAVANVVFRFLHLPLTFSVTTSMILNDF